MKNVTGTFLLISLFLGNFIYTQPLLDIFKFNYVHSPEKGLNEKQHPVQYSFYSFNITAPLELKKDGDAIILNPFFDHNQGSVSGEHFHVVSQGLATGFLKKNKEKTKSLLTTFIIRKNFEAHQGLQDVWQYGGYVLYSWKTRSGIWLKAGAYYNSEFFGTFFIPIGGIDWKVNEKNNLYGVLPGNFVYEHKVNNKFYYGGVFRALTNSYREPTLPDPCLSGDCSAKEYFRVDDNQLGLFGDYYLGKRIVLTLESGYTILRHYRFGLKGKDIHTYTNYKNDNFYFKAGLEYRFRFR